MKIEEHYLALTNRLTSQEVGREVEITKEELCDMLSCTNRNINLILQKMSKLGWIRWNPGRGRGNKSKLTLLYNRDKLIQQMAREKVLSQNIHEAFQLINQNLGNLNERTEFTKWLVQQLGYHNELVQEQKKDILRIPFYRAIPDLDPAYLNRRTEAHMVQQIFDTLVRFDPISKQLSPHLAHFWKAEDEYTRWTLYLRKGIYFHSGRLMNAYDVHATFSRLKDPLVASPHAWMCQNIMEIDVIDEYTIRFKFDQPNPNFMLLLSSERLSIIPREYQQFDFEFSRYPVGTGPFQVTCNNDSQFILQANDRYFDKRAHLDQLEIWILPNYNDLNQLDLIDSRLHFFSFQYPKKGDAYELESLHGLETGSTYLAFNLFKNGPQQDKGFRIALHHMIDRKQLIQELKGNRDRPASCFLPGNGVPEYHKRVDQQYIRELITHSSYQGEKIKLYTYQMPSNEENAYWIQRNCLDYGIDLEVTIMPIEELIGKKRYQEASIILSGEVLNDNIELSYLEMYQSGSSLFSNLMGHQLLQQKENMIQQAMALQSREERIKKLTEIEVRLSEEYALLFLYHSKQEVSYFSSLKGVALNALGWVNYKDLWFESTS